jgi:hypothetical protein
MENETKTPTKHYHTCRVCGHAEYESGCINVSKFPFVRYGKRHWAHADCGMTKWGMGFLARLSESAFMSFPALACQAAGLPGALNAELRRRGLLAEAV